MDLADLADVVAAVTADRDQRERALGDLLGLSRGLPEDFILLVSPDIGMRMTRDGVIPDRVRISWWLPPLSAYAMAL